MENGRNKRVLGPPHPVELLARLPAELNPGLANVCYGGGISQKPRDLNQPETFASRPGTILGLPSLFPMQSSPTGLSSLVL